MAIDANPPHKAKLSSERVLLQMLLQIYLYWLSKKNRNYSKDIVQSAVLLFWNTLYRCLYITTQRANKELRIETAIILEHTA